MTASSQRGSLKELDLLDAFGIATPHFGALTSLAWATVFAVPGPMFFLGFARSIVYNQPSLLPVVADS